jgi:hypothetical protein
VLTDGPDQKPVEIDFTPPYKRIPFMAGLREVLGLQNDAQWPPNDTLHTEEARLYFLRLVRNKALHGTLLACHWSLSKCLLDEM